MRLLLKVILPEHSRFCGLGEHADMRHKCQVTDRLHDLQFIDSQCWSFGATLDPRPLSVSVEIAKGDSAVACYWAYCNPYAASISLPTWLISKT